MKKLSFNQLTKLHEQNKIYNITLVNSFNYQVKQWRIDPKNKTFSCGAFSFNENVTTRTQANIFINYLKNQGLKEV